jgi:hypothetical protein
MSPRWKIGLAVFAVALIGLTLASAQAGTAAAIADVYSVKFQLRRVRARLREIA